MNTPLEDPVVTIGQDSYTLKFSLLCQYIADKNGINLLHIGDQIRAAASGQGALALTLDLFAAMVSGNFVERQRPVPTAQDWALRIPEESMPEITKAVWSVLGKWLGLPQTPPAAPQPEQATQPLQ
jgi:hypothetical protein